MIKKSRKKLILMSCAFTAMLCCAFGATVTLNNETVMAGTNTVQPTSNFYMKEGASIRLTSDTTGIRFSAQLKASAYDANKTYGVIIMPSQYLDGITSDYINALDTKYGFTEKNGEQIPDGYLKMDATPTLDKNGTDYVVVGSIANVYYDHINLDFSGIAYVTTDGVNYEYAEIVGSDYSTISRSVSRVATAAYNEYKHEGNPENYDATDVSILQEFMQKSKNKAAGNKESEISNIADTLSFGDDEVSVVIGKETSVSMQSNIPLNNVVLESSDASIVAVTENGTIKGLKKGTVTLTAKNGDATATCQVNANVDISALDTNMIADFSDDSYCGLVTAGGSHENYYPAEFTTEYLENKADKYGYTAQGVVKVSAKTNNIGAGFADYIINLPKAVSQGKGTTIRFMVDTNTSDDLQYRVLNNTTSVLELTGTGKDVWTTIYVPNVGGVEQLKIRFTGKAGMFGILYFDCVMDGEQGYTLDEESKAPLLTTLAGRLENDYLADFSDPAYVDVVGMSNRNESTGVNFKPSVLKAEYVQNVVDKNGAVALNALKITAKAPTGMYYGEFRVYLPKSITGAKYTIRYKLESDKDNWFARILLDNYQTDLDLTNSQTEDVWTIATNGNATNINKDYLYIRFGNNNSAVAGTTVTFYLDCIMEGNKVSDLTAQAQQDAIAYLGEQLTEGYLAECNSNVYTNLFSWADEEATFKAKSFKAEYVDSVEGSTNGALKITVGLTTIGSYIGARFKMYLPKQVASDGQYTIRVMIPDGSPSNYIICTRKLGATAGNDVTLNNLTANTWTESKSSTDGAGGKYIHFFTWVNGTTTPTEVTFYLDWVKAK